MWKRAVTGATSPLFSSAKHQSDPGDPSRPYSKTLQDQLFGDTDVSRKHQVRIQVRILGHFGQPVPVFQK